MTGSRFDALTQHAGTIDRKTSLRVLGGSLAAVAVASPLTADAKSKCKKKVEKKCDKQEQSCRDYWRNICIGVETCENYFFGCCNDLAKCKASQYFECVTLAPDI